MNRKKLQGLVTRPNFVGPCYSSPGSPRGEGIQSIWRYRKAPMVNIKQSELPGQVPFRPVSSIHPTTSVQLVSPAKVRLSLISRHLDKPDLVLNTPYSTERAGLIDLVPPSPLLDEPTLDQTSTMSTQANHPTLLIPGPVEFDDDVLQSMAHYR
jgi:hypothetical protein